MTRIEQLQKTGIRRLGTKERGFHYKGPADAAVSAADRNRIHQLKIPPAWNDVWINSAAGGTVQAMGRDAAGRLQYLYHADHLRRREARKFRRLILFAQALPKMRGAVAAHLRRPGLGKETVMASILRILSTCFLRPGSQVYASENGSFGLATLRRRHVRVQGNVVEFDFTGKSGVQQQSRLKDRRVARIVRGLLRHPSRDVFKFQNGDGEFVNVTRHHINEYIREVMGESFSAKDFRTWAGTLVCACALAKFGAENAETGAARKRKVVAAIQETADILGNTPAVCRSSYICPEILQGFEKGRVIRRFFKSPEELISYRGRSLHVAEKSLLAFMKRSSAD
ncbi:MAG TPA: DNA topoisomerase IB [Candidatus Polarisedimenticolia bacterium]|nr:DNA topoisomerase IB [Candidatus Polarisedimenticolia bacterium]